MFQFRRFPTYGYLIHRTLPCGGFPHSEISGSMRMCRSPKLIAACRVLHRLLMPRHSPCALISLTSQIQTRLRWALNLSWFSFRTMQVSTEVVHKIVSYPKKFPQCCFRAILSDRALCCLASSFLCSVFKVQIQLSLMVENSGIEPLTS